jgi:hypothetical protein
LQESVFKGPLDPELTFYSDVAWHTLSGYVTSHSNRYWSTENLHVHEEPLHDLKAGIWSARTIQPVSFPVTINSERYMRLILSHFFCQLTDEKSYGHFMQDNATAHTPNNYMIAIDEAFGERMIS